MHTVGFGSRSEARWYIATAASCPSLCAAITAASRPRWRGESTSRRRPGFLPFFSNACCSSSGKRFTDWCACTGGKCSPPGHGMMQYVIQTWTSVWYLGMSVFEVMHAVIYVRYVACLYKDIPIFHVSCFQKCKNGQSSAVQDAE
jgi:hypothetical protein